MFFLCMSHFLCYCVVLILQSVNHDDGRCRIVVVFHFVVRLRKQTVYQEVWYLQTLSHLISPSLPLSYIRPPSLLLPHMRFFPDNLFVFSLSVSLSDD